MEILGKTLAKLPERKPIAGDRVTLVPLDAELHAAPLFAAMKGYPELWLYMFDPPPVDEESYRVNLAAKAAGTDPFFYAVVDKVSSQPTGVVSYLRIEPGHRVIEVGNIMYSPRLQRTAAATETMYLMAKHALEDSGYRRYEWKCNALNQPSRRAALRLGFTFEGIFRQHMIIKGANRDTAWFAMLDHEWPAIKKAFEKWLDPSNFDSDGKQKHSLESFRKI